MVLVIVSKVLSASALLKFKAPESLTINCFLLILAPVLLDNFYFSKKAFKINLFFSVFKNYTHNILYLVESVLILLGYFNLRSITYLNKPRSLRSLKVVKNINDINKNIPIRKKPSCVF